MAEFNGDSSDNFFTGTDEQDNIRGNGGNDGLFGEDGNDFITGGDGEDRIEGNSQDDYLYGEGGNDALFGNSGKDYISGGIDDDYIEGDDGKDILRGNSGSDTLIGGSNNDLLVGGDGSDRFVLDYNNSVDFVAGYNIDEGDEIAFRDPNTPVLSVVFDDNSNLATVLIENPNDENNRDLIFIESDIDDSSIDFSNGTNLDDIEMSFDDIPNPERSSRGIVTENIDNDLNSDDGDNDGGIPIDFDGGFRVILPI